METKNNIIQNNQIDCTIEFHTATHSITVQNEIDMTTDFTKTRTGWHTGFNNSLLSCSTTKNMAAPYGIFTIGLAHVRDSDAKSWLDVISPLDMVVIRFASSASLGKGEKYTSIPVMVGFVESIRKISNYSESPTQMITIDGADFGKFFFDFKLYYRYLWDLAGFVGKAIGRGITPFGQSWEVLGKVFHQEFIERSWLKFTFRNPVSHERLKASNLLVSENSLLQGEDPYEQQKELNRITSGVYSLKEMIGFAFNAMDGFLPGLNGLEIPENPIWNSLAYYANLDFNELFFDLIDESKITSPSGKNAYVLLPENQKRVTNNYRNPLMAIDNKYILMLIHRPKPYLSRYGDTTRDILGSPLVNLHYNLPSIELQNDWIIQEDISVASHEVVNHFATQTSFLQALSGGSSTDGNDSAINLALLSEVINRTSLNMYGQRKLTAGLCTYPLSRQSIVVGLQAGEKGLSAIDALSADVNDNKPTTTAGPSENLQGYLSRHNELLHDWYIYNDSYRTGNFVLVGNPNIKIGTVVIQNEQVGAKSKKWNYYVQSVSHEFVRYSHYTTSVEVIRGFDQNEDLVYSNRDRAATNKEATLQVIDSYKDEKVLVKKHSKSGFSKLKLETQQSFLNTGVPMVNKNISGEESKDSVPFWESGSST